MKQKPSLQINQGITLVEIMVAMGLVAVSLMMVLSLIPAGLHSAQRAENLQAATAWSRELLETTPAPSEFPIPQELAEQEFGRKIGATHFKAIRTVTVSNELPYRFKVGVKIEWPEATRPLEVSILRYNPAGPEI